MTRRLVFVRSTIVYRVPDVCSVAWSAADWARVATRAVEPLSICALGFDWIATGERDAAGRMLYETASAPDPGEQPTCYYCSQQTESGAEVYCSAICARLAELDNEND